MSTPAPASSPPSLRPIRWMGWLFVVGSACFAIGVPLSQVTSIPPYVAAAVFFIGSIFFTSASSVQLRLAWLAQDRGDLWSSAIQWVGTVFFNVTTFAGLVAAVGNQSVSNQVIWRPDAIGSILFLVSSAIALVPESRKARHRHVRGRSWTIAILNMVGSIFFGLSAVGAYVVPSSDELLNSVWANGGTLWGALCFLVGAWLVIPPHKAVAPSDLDETDQ